MFTGLVEEAGQLASRAARGGGARLLVRTGLAKLDRGPALGHGLELGESISVDGVCLTVDKLQEDGFEADASSETLARTTLGSLPLGARVNLERAVALGQRMGGHIVSGHVDGVGEVEGRAPSGDAVKMVFRAPKELLRFIAEKGSICVNGVSLTVNGIQGELFDVMLIPHTMMKTSLADLQPKSRVNLEVDVLARYVARLIEVSKTEGDDPRLLELLQRAGYL